MGIRTESANQRLDRLNRQKVRIEAVDPNRQLKSAFELALEKVEKGQYGGGKRVYTMNEIMEKNQRELRAWGKLAPRLEEINNQISHLEKIVASGIPTDDVKKVSANLNLDHLDGPGLVSNAVSDVLTKIEDNLKTAEKTQTKPQPFGKELARQMQQIATALEEMITNPNVKLSEAAAKNLKELVYNFSVTKESHYPAETWKAYIPTVKENVIPTIQQMEKIISEHPAEKASETLERIIAMAKANLQLEESARQGIGEEAVKQLSALVVKIQELAKTVVLNPQAESLLAYAYEAFPKLKPDLYINESGIENLEQILYLVKVMENPATSDSEKPFATLSETEVAKLARAEQIIATAQSEGILGLDLNEVKDLLRSIKNIEADTSLTLSDPENTKLANLRGMLQNIVDEMEKVATPTPEKKKKESTSQDTHEEKPEELPIRETKPVVEGKEKLSETLYRLIQSAKENLKLKENMKELGEEGAKAFSEFFAAFDTFFKKVEPSKKDQKFFSDFVDELYTDPSQTLDRYGVSQLQKLLKIVKNMEKLEAKRDAEAEKHKEKTEPVGEEKKDTPGKPKSKLWGTIALGAATLAVVGAGVLALYLGIIKPNDKKIDQLNRQVKQEQVISDARADSILVLNAKIAIDDSTIAAQDSVIKVQASTIEAQDREIHKLTMAYYTQDNLAKELGGMYQRARDKLVEAQDELKKLKESGASDSEIFALKAQVKQLEEKTNYWKEKADKANKKLEQAKRNLDNARDNVVGAQEEINR